MKASSGDEIASTNSFELHNLLVIGYVESAQVYIICCFLNMLVYVCY